MWLSRTSDHSTGEKGGTGGCFEVGISRAPEVGIFCVLPLLAEQFA